MCNNNYDYFKIKDNFIDSKNIITLQNMDNGCLYLNILYKLYIKISNKYMPLDYSLISNIVGYDIELIEQSIPIYIKLNLMEVMNIKDLYVEDKPKISTNYSKQDKTVTKDIGFAEIEVVDNRILEVYNYWQTNGVIKHRNLSPEIKKSIIKALEKYDIDTIKKCIDRYSTIINDKTYFYKYKWKLNEFLMRKDGISSFLDDGTKWTNYINKDNNIVNKKQTTLNALAEYEQNL